MIRAKIHTEFLFDQITRDVERLAEECVNAGAEAGKAEAVAVGGARGLTEVEVIPARPTGEGYAAGVEGKWYYRFQSYGTLGRASRPKRPGRKRSHEPGTGITPNLMWQKARLAGRRAMQARANQGI